MPFLKEEKSEHERARTSMLAVQVCCARHCELPLSKMGNKGLFPGVAVPRAFFGTFFRFERKYCPPRGGSPIVRAVVGASVPTGRRPAPAGAPKGFPRGKQSARPALPCAPLVVCLNSGSLTAFGGCAHRARASLRSPLHPFGPHSAKKTRGKHPNRMRRGFPGPTHLRGPHCREYRLRFPKRPGPASLSPSHCLFPFPERRPPYVHSL